MLEMKRGACLDESSKYRYALFRAWNDGEGCVVFIMLNPSTADGCVDDPTILRCVRFARDWGYQSLVVVNLFALRSTNPDELLKEGSVAVGPANMSYIEDALGAAERVICAWGSHRAVVKYPALVAHVLEIVKRAGKKPMCLKLSKKGHPYHPLYLPADSVPFELPEAP